MSDGDILLIDKECLLSSRIMETIYFDRTRDYYASDDFSPEFYVHQALRGFIAVAHVTQAGNQLLLPQMQKSYCVLEWKNLQITRSLTRSLHAGNFRLKVNQKSSDLLDQLVSYHGSKNWICSEYRSLSEKLLQNGMVEVAGFSSKRIRFQLFSIELSDNTGTIIAGELGYVIGSVYTSLTGFCKREKRISLGRIQIVALAKRLQQCGFVFLNLGQPPTGGLMQYKAELGGSEVPRDGFLEKWYSGITNDSADLASFIKTDIDVKDLL
jgi:Leu/Phe-tRNA-protein transferase